MKQSTLDLIDDAMAFNIEVQEDNLNLQEMKYHLLQMSTKLNGYSENTLNPALFVTKSYEEYTNPNSLRKQISMELLNMIDSSIVDLDKKINYPHFLTLDEQSAIMYNVNTIENIRESLREMLTSIGELGNEGITYVAMKNKFIEDNELNLILTGTHISDEDYVEMNIPQPRMQSTTTAGMDKNSLNNSSKLLNSIVDQDILKALGKTKYEISAKMAIAPDDAIKSAHFIAQVVMAIKNAAFLMKNYYNATLNELNPAIKDVTSKPMSIDKMVDTIRKKQNEIRVRYSKLSAEDRQRMPDLSAALDWEYDSSMSEKEVRRQWNIVQDTLYDMTKIMLQIQKSKKK